MKTNRKVICSSSAVRYAETLFELNIPKETIEKTREIFSEVPQITDVLDNPTIRQEKKEQVIDKVFPREMRNFLKIVRCFFLIIFHDKCANALYKDQSRFFVILCHKCVQCFFCLINIFYK